MSGRNRRSVAAACGMLVLLSLGSCGGDEPTQAADVEDLGDGVAVACERLVDLANAVKGVQSAATIDEVEREMAAPTGAFIDSSRASGDPRLVELADTYEANYETYLSTVGLDNREAANAVQITQDRAAQHCLERGAMTIDEYPTQP